MKLPDSRAARWALAAGAALAAREIWTRFREEDLNGKSVLITGGSRGLGLALARAYAAEGCRLAICARDADELDRARRDLQSTGAEVLTIVCDVTDREQAERAVHEATARFGRVDVLVNNAGVIVTGPVEAMTEEDFGRLMDVTFWAALRFSRAVMPQMQERRGGHIVNITSIGGKVAVPHLVAYSAAKFAAVGLSEGLHAELAKDGIRVTTVVPGLMRTGSHLQAEMKGQQEKEFAMFGALDNTPGMSISAASAAARIVRATKRGEAEVTLSLPAHLMVWFHGLLPGAFTDLMGVVSSRLPGPNGHSGAAPGREEQPRMAHPRVSDPLGLGAKAAEQYNQTG